MLQPRFFLESLINMIDPENRRQCRDLMSENHLLFVTAPGALHNHQNWPGGYWDHIVEAMNYAVVFYQADPRPLPFLLSSALLVLFLHDIEKPWKYEAGSDGQLRNKKEFDTENKSHAFRDDIIKHYGIRLTQEEQNALKYVHGEGGDYTSKRRVIGPLAAFCHVCDVWVARIRFDCPMKKDDPWIGAERIKG